MSVLTNLDSHLRNRWTAATYASLVAAGCLYAMWWRATSFYMEYVYYPRVKAVDGYSYPQSRYLIFDCAETVCCLLGITTSALLFRYLLTGTMHRSTARYVSTFAAICILLAFGVVFGMMLRSAGL